MELLHDASDRKEKLKTQEMSRIREVRCTQTMEDSGQKSSSNYCPIIYEYFREMIKISERGAVKGPVFFKKRLLRKNPSYVSFFLDQVRSPTIIISFTTLKCIRLHKKDNDSRSTPVRNSSGQCHRS